MSLSYDKNGNILARIEGGKQNKKIISVIPELNKLKTNINNIKVEDGCLQQVPNPHTERSILYITGPSGSGKTTYASNYIKIYKNLYPNNPIFIFSALKEDQTLDELKVKRFKIDKESLIDDPINIYDLKNSLVIFDDIDCISDKNLKQAVYSILNQVLEIGRHENLSCILTNHLPSNGTFTRRILNECHSITYFPHSGNNGKMKKFLIDQIGLEKEDIIKNKFSKSRWATIFKNYPMVNMTEHEIRLLNDEDDKIKTNIIKKLTK